MAKIKLNTSLVISGYVPRDPFVNDGKSFISFTVGVDKSYMNNKNEWVNQVAWIPCKLWSTNSRIENLEKKIFKGQNVIVTGNIDQSSYKDKNGNTVNEVFVRIISIHIDEAGSAENANYSKGKGSNANAGTSKSSGSTGNGDYDFSFLNGQDSGGADQSMNDIGHAY